MTTPELGQTPRRATLLSRFLAFGLCIALVVVSLSARLAYLQLSPERPFAQLGDATRVVSQPIEAARGLISDRNGTSLVTNVPAFAIKVRPAELPFSEREPVVGHLGDLLGLSPSVINQLLDRNPGSRFDLVTIASDVPEDVARVVSEDSLQLPGVYVQVEATRQYTYGSLMAEILGYTGAIDADQLKSLKDQGYLPDDVIGEAGVEQAYETYLRGTSGAQQVEEDATGQPLQVLAETQQPKPGDSLQLTLDVKIQQEAQKALTWGLKAAHLNSGVFIVENPQTGEILAMVSLPSYDDNLFAKGISQQAFSQLASNKYQPLLNHAISEQYAPGSTYKLVTGSGVLADGKITAQTLVPTYPYIQLGGNRFVDWNHRGFGPINIYQGFGNSSDTFFYQMAAKLGIDRLAYWAKQWGFGAQTGIDLPGEVDGIVPSEQWKLDTLGQPIYPGEVFQAGIGQGYDMVTAIQLINAYSAMANGGSLYQPQVVRQIVAADGSVVRPFEPKLIRKLPMDSSVLRDMRIASRYGPVLRHTYNLVDLPIVMAVKTGTAEFGVRDAEGRMPYHNWAVGFVPKDPAKKASDPHGYAASARSDSNLAFLVFADDSNTVGNAATEIAKYFLQIHYNLKVDLRDLALMKRGNFYGQD